MKKELRDQIKQDEFASRPGAGRRVGGPAPRRAAHRRSASRSCWRPRSARSSTSRPQRAQEADRAFRDALTTFEAPIASELAPGAERPSGPVFATAEEKYKTAAAAFDGVARRYGSSVPALRAKYYAALAADRAEAVRRGGEGAQGDRSRAARGSSRIWRAWRSPTRTAAAVRWTRRSTPTAAWPRTRRQPPARLRAVGRGRDARGREALGRGASQLPAAVRRVPGSVYATRRVRDPSTCRAPFRAEGWP